MSIIAPHATAGQGSSVPFMGLIVVAIVVGAVSIAALFRPQIGGGRRSIKVVVPSFVEATVEDEVYGHKKP